jgi:F420-0:gamma-glutamyl ligase
VFTSLCLVGDELSQNLHQKSAKKMALVIEDENGRVFRRIPLQVSQS